MFRIIAHLTASIFFVSLLSGPVSAQELRRLLFTPNEAMNQLPLANDEKILVVGYVQSCCWKRGEKDVSFTLAYSGYEIQVTYVGALPDLFLEGKPALVKGIFEPNGLKADSIWVSLDNNKYLHEDVLSELRSLGITE